MKIGCGSNWGRRRTVGEPNILEVRTECGPGAERLWTEYREPLGRMQTQCEWNPKQLERTCRAHAEHTQPDYGPLDALCGPDIVRTERLNAGRLRSCRRGTAALRETLEEGVFTQGRGGRGGGGGGCSGFVLRSDAVAQSVECRFFRRSQGIEQAIRCRPLPPLPPPLPLPPYEPTPTPIANLSQLTQPPLHPIPPPITQPPPLSTPAFTPPTYPNPLPLQPQPHSPHPSPRYPTSTSKD